MYHVVLTCTGIPAAEGPQASADIAAEFVKHRSWHRNVACDWDGERLIFQADNDYDVDGRALRSELWECICARVAEPFDSKVRIETVTRIDGPSPLGGRPSPRRPRG